MEISFRDLMTVLHGMGFGALFMLAFSGAIAELYRMTAPGGPSVPSPREHRLLMVYLVAMVVLAWAAVFSGAYIVYPWYRAVPPAGLADLSSYPKSLLMSSRDTSGWHSLGMEWKEHVAWLAPISITMVAYVFGKYGPALARLRLPGSSRSMSRRARFQASRRAPSSFGCYRGSRSRGSGARNRWRSDGSFPSRRSCWR